VTRWKLIGANHQNRGGHAAQKVTQEAGRESLGPLPSLAAVAFLAKVDLKGPDQQLVELETLPNRDKPELLAELWRNSEIQRLAILL